VGDGAAVRAGITGDAVGAGADGDGTPLVQAITAVADMARKVIRGRSCIKALLDSVDVDERLNQPTNERPETFSGVPAIASLGARPQGPVQ
jgi:hypothetical protein